MIKVVIVTDGVSLDGLKLTKTDNIVVLGKRNASIPMELVSQLFEANARLDYVEDGTVAEFAFALGKLAATEGISQLITNIDDLKVLVDAKKTGKRTVSVSGDSGRAKRKPRQKKEDTVIKNLDSNTSDAADKQPEVGKKESTVLANTKPKRTRRTKTAKQEDSIMPAQTGMTKNFAQITKKDVEKVLTTNGFSLDYVDPILEALQVSSDITLDMIVRTKVAASCDVDTNTCHQLGELIKKTFAK